MLYNIINVGLIYICEVFSLFASFVDVKDYNAIK